MAGRVGEVTRKTKETSVRVRVDLDGGGRTKVHTGLGFLDHMLDLLGTHALLDLEIEAKGDLHVDAHHTVEDVGIALGEAFGKAVGGKEGIVRFGQAAIPMGEALVEVVLDICGRSDFVYNVTYPRPRTGDFDLPLLKELLKAFVDHARVTIHVNCRYGEEPHHIAEGVFKGLAVAIRRAAERDPRRGGEVPSTKGTL
ncbi:MAG: imidazoleglycerol-phosphate dehydratase HisB [Planctomycetales bacterium]|nr:imidazoleglycerol-phosphate dehydratase HisB [Planctomycetales bacterium]